jgi:predicted ATPase/DNA-binding winged helix-turn-helix (wHTH) protein
MAGPGAADSNRMLSFGPFRLDPARHILFEGETLVAIGHRALDILIALVERPGELVPKQDLMARVWPNTFVEDSNLRVNIALLRRALRDGRDGRRYITTDQGRGYRFVATLGEVQAVPIAEGPTPRPQQINTLPTTLHRVIGREQVVAALSTQLPQRRFITLVGPGGIGKTTVAVEVARMLAANYPDGILFFDLAPLGEATLLASALATQLGLSIAADDRLPGVLLHLKDRRMLLVLDGCEHIVGSAAAVAEQVVAAAPGVHVLATSREPLRAGGERVHRLQPLDSPTGGGTLTATEALAFPGVQLFVERAAATNLSGFELSDADAPLVAEICRRLDGIALAIELAASCAEAFGVRELAARLDDRFRLLTTGRRTALPRHQTLAATLDWSYQLLTDNERQLLGDLSVFVGRFSLDSALAVIGDHTSQQALLIGNLVAKSLLAFDPRDEGAYYRLLDNTRLYAWEKLRESGKLPEARRRHATHYRDLFIAAEAEHETRPAAEWRGIYARHIDNVRVALEWAFSPEGDVTLGIDLTNAVVSLWVQLSLMGECRVWVERSLASLDRARDPDRARMQLAAALGWSLMFAVGTARETRAAWQTTLDLANRLDDIGYRMKALWGLWVDRLNSGRQHEALQMAQHFAADATPSSSAVDLMMADRMLATSLHFMGDQRQARQHIDRTLARYAATEGHRLGARFQFDQQITAHYFQARILWLLGFADQAMRVVAANVEEARGVGSALSFGSVLGQGACPVALFSGDLDAAEHYGDMLLDHAQTHALRNWQIWAECFKGAVMIRRGDIESGLRILRAELEQAGDTVMLPRYLPLLSELALCLGLVGEAELAVLRVDEAIARCEQSGERWFLPELLRIKAELVPGDDAESLLLQARDLARQQDARAWELRIAISLARRNGAEARDALATLYRTFTEGFTSADLQAARDALSLREA